MQHTLLKDVNRQSYGWKVLVRLARLWEFRDHQTGTILYELDFVVVDRQGGTMEGYVPKDRIEYFKNQLKEGSVYLFEQFALSDARSVFRATNHKYRIRFTQRTKIKEYISYPHDFPTYAYNAQPFNVLSVRKDNNTLLSDVVGLITALTEVSITSTTRQNKRQIFITNGSERAVVTLWGEHAENFAAESIQKASTNEPMIVLFVAMTVGEFSGMLAFKSTTATRWYINIGIPEMAVVKHDTRSIPHLIEWQGSSRPKGDPVDTTIVDLVASEPYDRIGERFRFKVVITSVVPNENWWYLSCQACWKKLILDENILKCPRCSSTKGEPRYKLVLEGADIGSENMENPIVAHFTFFGPQGVAIIGKDAQLLVPDVTVQTYDIPSDIAAVVGKKFVLVADLAEGSLDADNLCFQVNSTEQITENENIVSPIRSTMVSTSEELASKTIIDEVSSSFIPMDLQQTPPEDVLHHVQSKDKGTVTTSKKRVSTTHQTTPAKRSQRASASKSLSFTDPESADTEC